MISFIDNRQREFLLAQPEYGMGYQLAEDSSTLFLNAELAVRLRDATSGFHLIFDESTEWFHRFAQETDVEIRTKLLSRFKKYDGTLNVLSHRSYQATTLHQERFFRYSAFARDRRIAVDGSVYPQTYVTSESDAVLVPSGLAAVSRYALPNPDPACYRYQFQPPAGTQIRCGTSAPNFGQAGGGVEVQITTGCAPGTVQLPPSIISER